MHWPTHTSASFSLFTLNTTVSTDSPLPGYFVDSFELDHGNYYNHFQALHKLQFREKLDMTDADSEVPDPGGQKILETPFFF
jgi:hypothetical protein